MPPKFAAALILITLTSCTYSQPPSLQPTPTPIPASPVPVTSDPDPNPSFTLELSQPFHLEFGRGGGMSGGLAMFILDSSGHCIISRSTRNAPIFFDAAEITLPQNLVSQIVDAINQTHLTSLDRSYDLHAADGTQWALHLTQGQNEKTIYCSNLFPPSLQSFAEYLDQILSTINIPPISWIPLTNRDLQKHLLDAVSRNTRAFTQ